MQSNVNFRNGRTVKFFDLKHKRDINENIWTKRKENCAKLLLINQQDKSTNTSYPIKDKGT